MEIHHGGERDHVFVFRPNENVLGEGKGELSKATLNTTRTTLGKEMQKGNDKFDNETIYYTDGSNSGIIIEVVSQTDKSVTFNVTFPNVEGDGTKDNPYLIYDIDTYLYLMKIDTKNKYYKLMKDLDFTNINDYPKISFEGNFNGNNKTLKNISARGTGIFYSTGVYDTKSTIENINVENINITPGTGDYLGGFTCIAENVTLKNIHIKSGSVKNIAGINSLSSTGGFAGNVDNRTTIENCSSSTNVESEKNVGGFIGINMNATIRNSYTNGKASGKSNVGAFIGVQCISDTSYNIPENVYYDYTKTKMSNAVGGYETYSHNLTTLPANSLGKGIVGISVLEEININGEQGVDFNITTTPKTSLIFSKSVSDSTIIKYVNNQIQGIKNGTAKIYADLKVGTQTMRMESRVNVRNINVVPPVINITGISLNKTSITLTEQETTSLSATITPTNHTMERTIRWTTSNSNIVSVDSQGRITAKLAGTATITATTVNGKSAKCIVTVRKKENPPATSSEPEVLKQLGLTKKDSYIVGFKLGNNVSDIKKSITSNPNITLVSIKNAEGREVSSGNIATNMKITLTINQKQYNYTVVVKGDVNGDGLIYATDYVRIKNHIMGKKKLEGAYLKAADINNDNNIYATDYVRIKNYIMGKGTIEQK